MPIEDLNAIKMGQNLVDAVPVAENVSDIWVSNSDIISWMLIMAIFFGVLCFVFFLLMAILKKRLK